MELATFALICRKCEEAPCVHSCYHEALEKQPDGILKRYSMRCTSCKACTIACPFGTILPEFIPYLHSRCDLCLEALREGRVPVCVDSCTHKAVEVREVEEDPKAHIYFVGPHLAVHSRRWQREEGALQKK